MLFQVPNGDNAIYQGIGWITRLLLSLIGRHTNWPAARKSRWRYRLSLVIPARADRLLHHHLHGAAMGAVWALTNPDLRTPT